MVGAPSTAGVAVQPGPRLSVPERLKLHCFERGIAITRAAETSLSHGGSQPISLHEYATTGGVTLKIGDVYINAPIDDWSR